MIVFPVVMFVVAALILVFSILIYRGKTNLIHSYHQTNVQDKKTYGKAMGKALSVISVALIANGIVALATSTVPTGILLVGLIVSMIPLFVVQRKYNGGMF